MKVVGSLQLAICKKQFANEKEDVEISILAKSKTNVCPLPIARCKLPIAN
jgi:hypothetical protein